MPITAAPAGSLIESLEIRLVEAITDHDLAGAALILELAAAQLGERQAHQMACDLPELVNSAEVPTTLRFLHGEAWIDVARAICHYAVHQLTQLGVALGQDLSFDSDQQGVPIVWMSRDLYVTLKQIAPSSLHLIDSFVKVE